MKGISYFGVFDPRYYGKDIHEIGESGFNWIVLPMTEEDALFRAETFRDMTKCAREAGLSVWISPLGVGKCFEGEGLSVIEDAVRERERAFEVIRKWSQVALSCAPDAILWDKPRNLDTGEFRDLRYVVGQWGVENIVVLQPDTDWPKPEDMQYVSGVGVNPYDARDYLGSFSDYVAHWGKRVIDYAYAIHAIPHAWVRTFRLTRGTERQVGIATCALNNAGVRRVGYWGYRGCTAMSSLASDNGEKVWESIKNA